MALSIGAWMFVVVLTSAADMADAAPIHLLAGRAKVTTAAAVAGALKRLESPSCQRVLTDFVDGSGRSLAASLDATGLTLPAYVARLHFIEGDGHRVCLSDGTMAFTSPGSQVIHVCSARFNTMFARRTTAESIVIHEILHTLGLGENPPPTDEISRQVWRRCVAR
jgi:hypothetical protein